MIHQADHLLHLLQTLHSQIRHRVVAACEQHAIAEMADIAANDAAGDTIYHIDRVSEALLTDFFASQVAPRWPLILIAEGLPGGQVVLPAGSQPEDAVIRVLVDPIDGTRGLMYQKRSAWILTGVAANHGAHTGLQHIELALQTEIPLVKQHLSDMLWATSSTPTQALRHNRLTGESWPLTLQPSRASNLAHGFASFCRFFPGARDELAAIDEAVLQAVLGPPPPGRAHSFEDQYISSGGQLYELIAGHDRFVADIRPLLNGWLQARGRAPMLCSHPYDLATALVAQQAGVVLTSASGGPLDAPLVVEHDVGWLGYANPALQKHIEPVLLAELRRRGLLD
jgi:fructose-1,6-bisphosphatase/inositol monophosphatase family enzyme